MSSSVVDESSEDSESLVSEDAEMSLEVVAADPEGPLSAKSRFLPLRADTVLDAQTSVGAFAIVTLPRCLLERAPRASRRVLSWANASLNFFKGVIAWAIVLPLALSYRAPEYKFAGSQRSGDNPAARMS